MKLSVSTQYNINTLKYVTMKTTLHTAVNSFSGVRVAPKPTVSIYYIQCLSQSACPRNLLFASFTPAISKGSEQHARLCTCTIASGHARMITVRFHAPFYRLRLLRCILILNLLVASADNLCKQFGSRSGPTECRAGSGSKLFGMLMY